MQDLEFRTTIAAMQMLRIRTGSVGMGGNGQFTRMSVLDDIGTQHGLPWHDALLEDYELGLRALLSGHQNRYATTPTSRRRGSSACAARSTSAPAGRRGTCSAPATSRRSGGRPT